MKPHRIFGPSFVAALCLFATGCISIEQEIFLNPDGSGEFVFHVSLPDLPEEMKKNTPGDKGNPEDTLKQFKTGVMSKLPPTIKLKEIKEVKQNGVYGFYAVLQFKQLKDLETILASIGSEGLKGGEMGSGKPPQWTIQVAKTGDKTTFTQQLYIDLTDPKPAAKPAADKPGEPPKPEEAAASNDLEKQLKPLIYSMFKLRFVLHAPAPITDTNADIVLNGKTAVWDGSFAAFIKDQKPIVMKASY